MFLTKIKKGIQEHGLLIYSVYAVKRLLGVVSDKIFIQFVFLFVLPVDTKRIKIPAFLKKNYKVQVFEKYDSCLDSFPVSLQTMEFRFKQNSVCFVVFKKEIPIGVLWLVLKSYREDIVYCDFEMGDKAAWDYDLWINEEYRLTTPAFSILWHAAFEFLSQKEVKYVFSRISTLNSNSVDVHTRLGGYVIGKLLFLQYRGRELCIDFIQRRLGQYSFRHQWHRKWFCNG